MIFVFELSTDVTTTEEDHGESESSRGRFIVSAASVATSSGSTTENVGRFRLIPQTASPFLQRGRFSVIPEEEASSGSPQNKLPGNYLKF